MSFTQSSNKDLSGFGQLGCDPERQHDDYLLKTASNVVKMPHLTQPLCRSPFKVPPLSTAAWLLRRFLPQGIA